MPEIEIPEIREITPPLPPETPVPIYFWIILAVLVLIISFAIFAFLRAKSHATPALVSDYDARKAALDRLHQLKEGYLELPSPAFALEASLGLREYLTAHYGNTTPYETGREFLDRQDDNRMMSEEKYIHVRDLYERAERLKYAPAPGADSERLSLVDDCIGFVCDDNPGAMFIVPSNPSNTDNDNHANPLPA